MNDPHVVALFYNVKHSAAVDYSEAKPLEHEEKDFTITIAKDKACFTMKAHYATEEKARKPAEEYIQVREFAAGLEGGPNAFTLEFDYSRIEDRQPQPGMAQIHGVVPAPSGTARATSMPIKKSYPPPPQSGLKITPDVQSMYDRLMGYCSGRDRPPSMAAFCLDVLQGSTGSKSPSKKAVEMYGIERAVIKKIARLSNNKGGPDARKRVGIDSPLEPEEKRFLEEAIKAIIRQMAAHAYDPDNMPPEIKLTDLLKC